MKLINYIKNYSEFIIYYFFKIILPKSKTQTGKLLLINTGEIGDLVVSSLLLENQDIFDSYDKVNFLIKEQYLELFNSYTGKVNFIGYNYKKYKFSLFYKFSFLSKLRKEGYEQCIHLTAARGILNEEMTHLIGANSTIVLNSFWEYLGSYLGNFDNKYRKIIAKDIVNEYEKHFELIRILRNDTEKEIVFNKGITFNKNNVTKKDNFIVVAPFTSLMNRGWGKDSFSKIIKILSKNYSIKLLGTRDQKNDLVELKNNYENVEVLAGTLSLNDIPNMIIKAKLFIGLDSGLTHIALKVGTPIIAIIGGGEFERFFPYRESENIKFLYHKMDCFLCHWQCIKKEMFCMTDVTPEQVLIELDEILSS